MMNRPDDANPRGPKESSARSANQTWVADGAWVGPSVEVGEGVVIAPGAVIGFEPTSGNAKRVVLGEGSYVGPGVHVEPGVVLGRSVRIEAGSFLGEDSRLGDHVLVGPHCVVMAQCDIREHAVLAAEVFTCPRSVLEAHCRLMPGVKLLDAPCPPLPLNLKAPTIGRCAVVGVNAIIWSGVTIGSHAIIAAGSVVKHPVPDYQLAQGSPAKSICDIRWIRMKLDDLTIYPYPWVRYYIPGEDMTKPAPEV